MDRRNFLKTTAAAVPCMWLPLQLTGDQFETKFPVFSKPTITDEGIKLLLDCHTGSKRWLVLLAHDMRPYDGCVPLSWDEDTSEFTNVFGNKEFIINTVQKWYGIGLYSTSTDTVWSWSAFEKPVKLPIGPIDPGYVREFDYISYRECQAEFS